MQKTKHAVDYLELGELKFPPWLPHRPFVYRCTFGCTHYQESEGWVLNSHNTTIKPWHACFDRKLKDDTEQMEIASRHHKAM
jgi:hypothetical protein